MLTAPEGVEPRCRVSCFCGGGLISTDQVAYELSQELVLLPIDLGGRIRRHDDEHEEGVGVMVAWDRLHST